MATTTTRPLYNELLLFPQAARELNELREDAYSVMYATPILTHSKPRKGKRASGGSRIENLVCRVLMSTYMLELSSIVRACTTLYDEVPFEDQTLLLRLWRGEPLASFPERLLWRYEAIKHELDGGGVA
jgi:hypothetical protein